MCLMTEAGELDVITQNSKNRSHEAEAAGLNLRTDPESRKW